MKGMIGVILIVLGLMFSMIAVVDPSFAVVNLSQSAANSTTPIENTTVNQLNYAANPGWSLSTISGTFSGITQSWSKATTSINLNMRLYEGQTITLNYLEIQTYAYQVVSSHPTYEIDTAVTWVNLTGNNIVLSNYYGPYSNGVHQIGSYGSTVKGQPGSVWMSPTFTIPSGTYLTNEVLTITFLAPYTLPYTSQSFSTVQTSTTVPTGSYLPINTAVPFGYGFIYPIQNVGHYYVYVPSNNTWVKLLPTTSISISYTSYPVTLEFAYVEDNGTTTDIGSMYLTLNSNQMGINNVNQTTVNGHPGWTIIVHIQKPGQYTINGYLQPSYSSSPLQVMNFVYNTNTQSGGGGSITGVNYVSLAIGVILLVAGAMLEVKRV